MGGAQVALAHDVQAPLWNPAGLAFARRTQGYLSHANLFNDLSVHDFAGVSLELGPGLVAGVNWLRLGIDNIPRFSELQRTYYDRLIDQQYRSDGVPIDYFSDNENAIIFNIAQAYKLNLLLGAGLSPIILPVQFSFGLNLKLLNKNLDSATASAQSIDLGLLIHFLEIKQKRFILQKFSIGVVLYDMTSTGLNWDTSSEHKDPIAPSFSFGLGYQRRIFRSAGIFTIAFDKSTRDKNDQKIGLEYLHKGLVAVRAGKYNNGWAAGAGLRLNKIKIDYAFMGHELGATHRVGGGISF
ncbi:MAG: hypothetical protein H6696_05295 [Deferribacteres bacterium]|nr:hypothetical protein [candidate division KSB1 bacterium]MCB9501333.1 hypothetical protein [Deferribacteres bacterium]